MWYCTNSPSILWQSIDRSLICFVETTSACLSMSGAAYIAVIIWAKFINTPHGLPQYEQTSCMWLFHLLFYDWKDGHWLPVKELECIAHLSSSIPTAVCNSTCSPPQGVLSFSLRITSVLLKWHEAVLILFLVAYCATLDLSSVEIFWYLPYFSLVCSCTTLHSSLTAWILGCI